MYQATNQQYLPLNRITQWAKPQKKSTALSTGNQAQAFSFGEPIPVLDRAEVLNYFESVLMYEKYYNPPINLSYLAKALNASAHHNSAITVKKNILLSTCKTTALLPRTQLEKLVQDYLVFGNAYVEKTVNSFGKVVSLKSPLAKYMRVGVETGVFLSDCEWIWWIWI